MRTNDYTVLENRFIFASGLQYLHVMRVGEPVDVETVLRERVPGQSRDWYVDLQPYEEGQALKRYHLELFYPYRGGLRLLTDGEKPGLVHGIFWRRTGRERMSVIIQDAADAYWARYDAIPSMALVQSRPKNAPEKMTLGGCCQGVEIVIREAAWMPKACVIVCGAGVESDTKESA